MSSIDFTSLAYMSFRLAPFILVSFFSLSSVFNQDLKGIVYLAGLLMACIVAVMTSNSTDKFDVASNIINDPDRLDTCHLLTLSGTAPISKLPLSCIVFTYTFAYLLYVLIKYKLLSQNVPTLLFFPALIFADIIWNYSNGCASTTAVIASIIIGITVGIIWASIIDSLKITKLQYMNGIGNNQTCSISKQKFKCTTRTR